MSPDKKCIYCHQPLPPGADICPACGKEQSTTPVRAGKCLRCGRIYSGISKFCEDCGVVLEPGTITFLPSTGKDFSPANSAGTVPADAEKTAESPQPADNGGLPDVEFQAPALTGKPESQACMNASPDQADRSIAQAPYLSPTEPQPAGSAEWQHPGNVQGPDATSSAQSEFPAKTGRIQKPKKKVWAVVLISVICCLAVAGSSVAVFAMASPRDFSRLLQGNVEYAAELEEEALTGFAKDNQKWLAALFPAPPEETLSGYTGTQIEFTPDAGLSDTLTRVFGPDSADTLDSLTEIVNQLSVLTFTTESSSGSSRHILFSKDNKELFSALDWTRGDSVIFELPHLSDRYVEIESPALGLNSINWNDEQLINSLQTLKGRYLDLLAEAEADYLKKQPLTVCAHSITADRVSLTLQEENLRRALLTMLDAIQEDAALQNILLKFANVPLLMNGTSMDLASLQHSFYELRAKIASADFTDMAFTVSFYVERDSSVLAHTYTFRQGSEELFELDFIFPAESGASAIRAARSGTDLFLLEMEPVSTTAGSVTLTMENGNGLRLDYRDLKETEYYDRPLYTGTFTLSPVAGSGAGGTGLFAFDDFSVTLTTALEKGYLINDVRIDWTGVGTLLIKNTTITTIGMEGLTVEMPTLTPDNSFILDISSGADLSSYWQELVSEYRIGFSSFWDQLMKNDADIRTLAEQMASLMKTLTAQTDF